MRPSQITNVINVPGLTINGVQDPAEIGETIVQQITAALTRQQLGRGGA